MKTIHIYLIISPISIRIFILTAIFQPVCPLLSQNNNNKNNYYYYYYYYYRFTAVWILSGTTRVSQQQKGKIRKVDVPIWIYRSKR